MSRFLSSILKTFSSSEEKPPAKISDQVISYTNRLVLIPYPSDDIKYSLFQYLESEYGPHYKIWNLSEYPQQDPIFTNKCVEFLFIGYPNPPLLAFFSIFESIRAFLEQDERNTIAIHCQTTRSRSYMTLAGYLLWTNTESNIEVALKKICKLTRFQVELLPSQHRYLSYLQSLFRGSAPHSRLLCLRKIILNGIPVIETQGTAIRPYIQIFKDSSLFYNSHSQDFPPESYEQNDSSIIFELNLHLEDDVFLRCRHLGRDGQGVTIFRVMFHSAFITENIVKFKKSDLDGASTDPRFPDSFEVDLIFDSNERISNDSLSKISVKHPEVQPKQTEEIKLEKNESDDEMDSYFKQLEKQ